MDNLFSFIPGKPIEKSFPLSRYLPPISSGIASKWLRDEVPGGGLILDPFGVSPNLVVEIAKAGYPVLVAANNPISRFLIEMGAIPPEKSQFTAALAELATASKGMDRIEPYIRSLYLTECSQCGKSIEAESFLWEKDAATPYGRIFHCQYCGENGERSVSQADIERAARYSTSTLHYARALERIAPPNHPDRVHAEEAVSVYLPRALYAIFTLINKLDALNLPDGQKKLIDALLLTTFDQSNNLWGHPTSRERPKSLALPNRFKENNIWMSLEKGINLWVNEQSIEEIKISNWPEFPIRPGTIYIFDGRLRDLIENLKGQSIKAVVTALPRPNQAFWTLSALWAGWLWGREAIGPFINVLKRRRYDWNWHATALYAAFNHLSGVLKERTSVFALIGEFETGFNTAALIAANNAGYRLMGFAPRYENAQAQLIWKYSSAESDIYLDDQLKSLIREASINYLKERGEPASYLRISTSALVGIYLGRAIKHPLIKENSEINLEEDAVEVSNTSPSQDYSYIQSLIRGTLLDHKNFQRFTESDAIESGSWWLKEDQEYQPPLADRVEKTIVELLVKKQRCSLAEIDLVACQRFPGLFTPPAELIHICIDSYAYQLPSDNHYWQLREEDIPQNRHDDLKDIQEQIINLGEKLGFTTIRKTSNQNRQIISWTDDGNQEVYTFFPIASALIGEIMLLANIYSDNPIIVLPGGRANLVAYKMNKDPRYIERTRVGVSTAGRWRILKFRHLRWLLENPLITIKTLNEQLDLDPLTYTTPQLRLL